ncbi:MAG: hypothetical protein ACP5PO_06930 [Desulfurella sp.]|uniref:hypothetical protein n=1 Tax=Desulfurella sp. TaxID=1962857 RepID=UPI003D0D1818
MQILNQAKNKILPLIQDFLDKMVFFETKENCLYTDFLGAKSEGLTFGDIKETLSVEQKMGLDLHSDKNKELFVGFLNAFVNFYNKEPSTIFCKNNQFCFNEMGNRFFKRYGSNLSMCFIDNLESNFEILNKYGFKINFLNFQENAFQERIFDCIANNFLVLCNGYCLTKPWADDILEISSMDNANRLVIFFGPQSAFVSMINLKRLCFFKEV